MFVASELLQFYCIKDGLENILASESLNQETQSLSQKPMQSNKLHKQSECQKSLWTLDAQELTTLYVIFHLLFSEMPDELKHKTDNVQ